VCVCACVCLCVCVFVCVCVCLCVCVCFSRYHNTCVLFYLLFVILLHHSTNLRSVLTLQYLQFQLISESTVIKLIWFQFWSCWFYTVAIGLLQWCKSMVSTAVPRQLRLCVSLHVSIFDRRLSDLASSQSSSLKVPSSFFSHALRLKNVTMATMQYHGLALWPFLYISCHTGLM
jgi:hypothetical protein